MESESFGGGLQYTNGTLARLTRTDSPYLVHRVRAAITLDSSTQTEYGTMRGYLRVGAEQTYPLVPDQAVYFDSQGLRSAVRIRSMISSRTAATTIPAIASGRTWLRLSTIQCSTSLYTGFESIKHNATSCSSPSR